MMKKGLWLILIPLFLFSQGVEWYGYYETELDGAKSPTMGDAAIFGYQKLRLDMETHPSERLRFSANIAAKQYFGDNFFYFDDFVHPDYIPEPYHFMFSFSFPDTFFLDNMALDLYGEKYTLTLGRQQMSPGCAYAWNPVDLFNKKDIMDPTYEQTGRPGVTFTYSLPFSSQFTYHRLLSQPFRADLQMIILKGNFAFSSLSLSYAYTEDRDLLSTNIYKYYGDRQMIGFTEEADLFGVGLRIEYAHNILSTPGGDEDTYVEYVAGMDYTFGNSLYFLAEYFYNDFAVGKNAVSLYAIDRAFSGDVRSLNREYLFAMLSYPLSELWSGSMTAIMNLEDGSGSINPQLDVSLAQNLDLSMVFMLPAGPEKSEFGWQEWGGRIRLNAYF